MPPIIATRHPPRSETAGRHAGTPNAAPRKLILNCNLSPGDIIMLTAAVRDLHRAYPGRFLTDVRTLCPGLWEHNPYLTRLKESDPGTETLNCSYPLIDQCNLPYHCLHGFVDFLNARLSLAIRPTAFRGDLHLSEQEMAWYSQVHELTGEDTPFWIIDAGGKYDITIKWWETGRFQEVVDHFRGRILFVQVGACGHHHPRLDGVIDLRGQTSLRELIRLVHHAAGVLCPVTSLMHLAAAVPGRPGRPGTRPCVVIAGGREPVHWEAYPEHQFLHTTGLLPCCRRGGCWRDRTVRLNDGDPRDRASRRCVEVVDGLPRCMDLIRPEDVIRHIELFYESGRLKPLSRHQRRAAERGVAASQPNPFDRLPLNLHSAGLACDAFIKTLPPAPGNYAGRGIVVCGGGPRYFPCVWVCVNMLRHLGCKLPIELWHLGRKEHSPARGELVRALGVTCIDAFQVRRRLPVRRLHGWELKAYALLHSSFREVLLLDADNVPVVDPECLFDTPEYRRAGAVFWPDYFFGLNRRAAAIWRSCGLRQPDEPEFESGQILVDKQRCWAALRLALWFNEHSDFYYRHIHGDKETFHLAFRKLKQPYALVPKPIQPLHATMCQHDFQGRRVFQHRNLAKWSLLTPNPRITGFLHEAKCLEFLAQLRKCRVP